MNSCSTCFLIPVSLADCSEPDPPMDGRLTYTHTGEGGTSTFWCNYDQFPSDVRTSVCKEGEWTPAPVDNCTGNGASRVHG